MSPELSAQAATPARAPHRPPALMASLALLATALDAALLALALGGFGALLAHARALALLGVYGVGAVTLALLRPVRGQDTVAVAPDPPLTMLALGVIPLLTPPIAALGERLGWWPLPGGAALRWGGVALAAAGLALRIAAMARLRDRFSPRLAVQRTHALETGGPYGLVRHPGYLGTLLAALGAVLTFGSGAGLVPAALLALLLAARVRREEALLEERFGEEWRRYRERTGAFLPRPVRPR